MFSIRMFTAYKRVARNSKNIGCFFVAKYNSKNNIVNKTKNNEQISVAADPEYFKCTGINANTKAPNKERDVFLNKRKSKKNTITTVMLPTTALVLKATCSKSPNNPKLKLKNVWYPAGHCLAEQDRQSLLEPKSHSQY